MGYFTTAILIAGLFGVAFAIPSFRLEGPYLALATLGGGSYKIIY